MLRGMSSEGAKAFIARWAAAGASERANSQPFLCELCDMLGVAKPEPTRETGYAFEYDVTEHHPDGSTTKGRIDRRPEESAPSPRPARNELPRRPRQRLTACRQQQAGDNEEGCTEFTVTGILCAVRC
jgi:hypothetical protein